MREPAMPQRGFASMKRTISESAPGRNSASGFSRKTSGELVAANARLQAAPKPRLAPFSTIVTRSP